MSETHADTCLWCLPEEVKRFEGKDVVIHPVWPVCVSVPSGSHAQWAICYRLLWSPGQYRTLCGMSGRYPGAEGLGRRPNYVTIPLAFRDSLYPCHHDRRYPTEALPVDWWSEWQPWSAHEPFADEVIRWWPSDECPPSEPAIMIEDTLPDIPPEIISWRDRGGLLDVWI